MVLLRCDQGLMAMLRMNSMTAAAKARNLVVLHPGELIFSFILSIAVCFALSILLAWHIYLVCARIPITIGGLGTFLQPYMA
jgi:hypothetical protein